MRNSPVHIQEEEGRYDRGRGVLLAVWAALFLLIIAVSYAIFDWERDQLIADRHDSLWRIVTQKTIEFEAWRDEKVADLLMIAREPTLGQMLERSRGDGAVATSFEQDVQTLISTKHYESVFLLDTRGTLRMSWGERPARIQELRQFAAQALDANGPIFSDFELKSGPRERQVRFVLLTPVHLHGRVAGLLGIQLDPYAYLVPLLRQWPAQTDTAETLLVHRDDHSVVFVRQLRFRDGIPAGAALTALLHPQGHRQDQRSLIQGTDYRGKPVAAVAHTVARTPWLLVSKMDRDEFFAPVRKLCFIVLAVGSIVALLMSGIIYTWWRKERTRRRAEWYESELRRQLLSTHFDYLTKYANDIILLTDDEGKIIEANDRAVEAYGYSRKQLLQMTWEHLRDMYVYRPLCDLWDGMKERRSVFYESWHRRKDGTRFPVEVSGRLIRIGTHDFFQAIIRDITERREYQRRIERLRDFYAALSQTNQAIIHSVDRESLFETICEVAVKYGHFRAAWIGLVDWEAGRLIPVSSAGEHPEFFTERQFSLDPASPDGRGPAVTAVREREVRVVNDFLGDPKLTHWHGAARRFGVRSGAAFPLTQGGSVIGAMTVYSAEADYFDEQLIALLQEMAQDIDFALDSFERERQRRAAEQGVAESEARYRALFENMSAGVAVFDAVTSNGPFIFKDVNRALERIERVRRQDVMGRELSDAFPEVVKAGMLNLFCQVCRTGRPSRGLVTLYREGQPPGFRNYYVYPLPSGELVAVYDDVTEQRYAEESLRKNEERLSLVLQATNDGFWDYDFTTGYVYYSPRWLSLLGYEMGEVESSPAGWERLVHPDDLAAAKRAMVAHFAGKTDHYQSEYRMLTKSGDWRWILARGKVVRRDVDGRPLRVTGTQTDITERRRTDEQLRLWATVFENSGEAIFITDRQRRIVSANRAFSRITGYTLEEVYGKDPKVLSSGDHDESFYQNMWACIDQTGYWQGEIWDRRKSGETYPQWMAISVSRDSTGEILNYIAVFSDISEQKAAEERIRFLAHHDFLTGLPNRSALRDRIDVVLAHAKRRKSQVAVLFVDLDRFKNINDSLGHHVGDELLKGVATRLSNCVRSEDTVSRLGGDEFVLALSQVRDADDAAHIAHKVIETVARPYQIGDHTIHVTPSIGISLYPDDGENIDDLLRTADAAMYHAKERGRNNFQFFIPELNQRALKRLSLENRLRDALERGEFMLHYQPQINLRTGVVVGAEALLRWRRNGVTVSDPAEFIPIAEESGLIVPLGQWVLREACKQQKHWVEEGLGCLPVAVNISALQFSQKDFRQQLESVLQETGIDPHCLEIELTEGMLMSEAETTITVLRDLKEMGISVSIDDFGTGYSSMNYLRRFPIDRLKVDQSFIRDMEVDATDQAITGAIIGLGKSLGLRVVAEGVETETAVKLLREQQCEDVQGNYFSHALPPKEFDRWLEASGRTPSCGTH